MYSREQVLDGLVRYIKSELLPILPDYAKVLGGAVLLHNAKRITEMALSLGNSSAARTMDIVSGDGMIDIDLWASEIKNSMQEFGSGKLVVDLPFIQPITVNEQDVDTLKRYIKGELR